MDSRSSISRDSSGSLDLSLSVPVLRRGGWCGTQRDSQSPRPSSIISVPVENEVPFGDPTVRSSEPFLDLRGRPCQCTFNDPKSTDSVSRTSLFCHSRGRSQGPGCKTKYDLQKVTPLRECHPLTPVRRLYQVDCGPRSPWLVVVVVCVPSLPSQWRVQVLRFPTDGTQVVG